MLWRGGRRSDNVEDDRGAGGGFSGGLGGGGFGGGSIRLGGFGIIALFLVCWFFGIDPSTLLNAVTNGTDSSYQQTPSDSDQTQSSTSGSTTASDEAASNDEMKDFVSSVLASTEDVWSDVFQSMGRHYVEPKLVLFTGAVRSACGFAQSASGPFYCPSDSKVYIDLSFYDDLKQRFHAPGDFAQAYVIAHEVGHHVQHLLGLMDDREQSQLNHKEANAASVRIELQADCFAGIWAHHADQDKHILEVGDVDEALQAASAIGDDRLQKQAQGYVVPDSFTHGTSAQRVHWFKTGFQKGSLEACDTSGSLD